MSSEAFDDWYRNSLDTVPDLTVILAIGAGETLTPSLDIIAGHLALRSLSWELIAVALDAEVVAPFDGDAANAFFIGRGHRDERLRALRSACVNASGRRVLLVGADVAAALVQLDEIVGRLDRGSDIVLGWPFPDAATPSQRDLPTFMGCPSGVARALSDTRAVYGGSTFSDAVQVAHFWGLQVDELQVDIAVADTVRSRGSIRPAARVCVGPAGSPIAG